MNKYFFAVLTALLVASIGFAGCKTTRAGGVLTVNDLHADPFAYKGNVTFTGVVAGLSKTDPKRFAVIDTSEAILCKQTGCANFYIAVNYEGERPNVWDEVKVTGRIVDTKKVWDEMTVLGRVSPDSQFKATQVDIVRHLTF